MKRTLLGMILLLAFVTQSAAIELQVRETTVGFKDGNHNALTIKIVGVYEKQVIEAWAKKMKKNKGKTNKNKHGVVAERVTWQSIFATPSTYLAKTELNLSTLTLSIAVNLGGAYLNSSDHESAYKSLEKELIAFAKELLKAQVQVELLAAKKILKKNEKKLASLQSSNARSKKNIEGWKQDITDAEADIVQNESEQVTQEQVIVDQKTVVEEIIEKESQI